MNSLADVLNALPSTADPVDWLRQFSSFLEGLFADVDRVVVRVNLHCHMEPPPPPPPRRGARSRTMSTPAVKVNPAAAAGAAREIASPAYDPTRYHAPFRCAFQHAGEELGSITLLTDRAKPEISDGTRNTVMELEPFLVFALTDIVARYSFARPVSRVFRRVLGAIAEETSLTTRELEVLALHVFGRKYIEIAHRLYISIDTVKKHVKKIHRKTGASSATELFARYFAPLVEDDE